MKIEKPAAPGKAGCGGGNVGADPRHAVLRCCLLACALGVLAADTARADGPDRTLAPRTLALAGTAAALADGVWSMALNPAAAAGQEAGGALHAAPAPFGLPELRTAGFAAVAPVRWGGRPCALGGVVSARGFELYRETAVECVAAASFGTLRCGAALGWDVVAIRGYGADGAATFAAGAQAGMGAGVVLGFCVRGSGGGAGGASAPRPAPEALLGIGWDAGEEFFVAADLAHPASGAFGWRLGMCWKPLEALALRAGISGEPARAGLGLSLRQGSLALDIAAAAHPDLGWTQSLGIEFQP